MTKKIQPQAVTLPPNAHTVLTLDGRDQVDAAKRIIRTLTGALITTLDAEEESEGFNDATQAECAAELALLIQQQIRVIEDVFKSSAVVRPNGGVR